MSHVYLIAEIINVTKLSSLYIYHICNEVDKIKICSVVEIMI